MKRIRIETEVWIVKSVWAERPNYWQTDIYGTEREAQDMFEACIRRSVKAKLLKPDGEISMDFATLGEEGPDGPKKQSGTQDPMRDGGLETWG